MLFMVLHFMLRDCLGCYCVDQQVPLPCEVLQCMDAEPIVPLSLYRDLLYGGTGREGLRDYCLVNDCVAYTSG